MQNRIFSTDSPKAIKAAGFGYINAIHYMAPADMGGVGNLCVKSSAGCRALCLGWFSGQAGMVADIESLRTQGNSVRLSRIVKAQRFMRERNAYVRDVVRSIELLQGKARKMGKKLCVRLNGSTDIVWEGIRLEGDARQTIFDAFPDVDFVDYTKIATRFKRKAGLPRNYHLTLSRSETNEAECVEALGNGVNVAVVFAGDKPATWNGFNVIDGDQHDLRQLDPRGARGVVVALSPKGRKAKKDQSGFVVRT